MSESTFHVCPICGSGKIEMGNLAGPSLLASCLACGWKGEQGDLLIAPSNDVALSDDQDAVGTVDTCLGIANDVAKTYMRLIAQHAARGLGLAMVQAGIVGPKQPKELTRLIRAASLGAHRATLEEVELMQKELKDASERNSN